MFVVVIDGGVKAGDARAEDDKPGDVRAGDEIAGDVRAGDEIDGDVRAGDGDVLLICPMDNCSPVYKFEDTVGELSRIVF